MSAIDEQKRRRLLLFGTQLNERGIEVLEKRFECHLPCFLRVGTDGGYDPLDAMRRDADREVCNWLKEQYRIFRKENAMD